MDGEVRTDGLSRRYSAPLEKCKHDCDARIDCNSFEHKVTSDTGCKLLKETVPIDPKLEEDFQFCRKIWPTGTCLHEWIVDLI